ncbi:MAG: ATP-binding protein [Elusimicrobia bacterium]|nr:ATP-binding protein [Elusimicrobiota bacterium]
MKRIQDLYLFDEKLQGGKMVFLSGPRQVGKTTFAQNNLKKFGDTKLYFNWDDPFIRREYVRNPHFLDVVLSGSSHPMPWIVFDEIHKHKNWKNILKGLYDHYHSKARFLITGSARLDYFRSSGDSLVGRYFSYKMLPLSLAEGAQNFDFLLSQDNVLSHPVENKLVHLLDRIPIAKFKNALKKLYEFGGFPEPFLKASANFSVKWRRDYQSLLSKEDVRDLSRIQDLKGLEQLLLLLPERVGSPLSINSLREDLQVNHRTISNWLEVLKKVYLLFSILPWSKNLARAIRKENKFYFYDWTFVEDPGARFENMAAVHLLRLVSRWNELGLGNFDLRYVRTKQKQEIDFLIIKNQKPLALFEAKVSDTQVQPSSLYLSCILSVPFYQVVLNTDKVVSNSQNIFTIPAVQFFAISG